MFMFPLKNLARKSAISELLLRIKFMNTFCDIVGLGVGVLEKHVQALKSESS